MPVIVYVRSSIKKNIQIKKELYEAKERGGMQRPYRLAPFSLATPLGVGIQREAKKNII